MPLNEPPVLVADRGEIRIITINRPERLNALDENALALLARALRAARGDDEVRVTVLTGTGDRAFCVGGDIAELGTAGNNLVAPLDRPDRLPVEILLDTYKPTIAAINGTAVGNGFEHALACDLRVVARGARLGLPEVKRGMGALFGSVVLPRLIPTGLALEMLMTGELITAEHAATIGLVNRLVDRGDALNAALDLAQRIIANAPLSVRRVKEMALKGLDLPIEAALRLNVGPDPYRSDDLREGLQAFREHRSPTWSGH